MITKPTLKNSIFIGLFLLSLAIKTNGQQTSEPKVCKNPPKGYELGGYFRSNVNVACLDYTTNTSIVVFSNPVAIDNGSEEYIFNYKDGDSLNFIKQNSYTVNKAGIYWVIQKGTVTENGTSKIVLSCNSVEVVKTEVPELEYSTCGPRTVNILIKDTPINRQHSGYRIDWGQKDIINFKPASFPYIISHNYSEPGEHHNPTIQGFYTWRGVLACMSQPYEQYFRRYFSITKLESQNYAKEAKIQMKGSEPEKEYFIQYKAKTATEWVESATKIKTKAADTFAEATITGLDPITQYCFRLVEKDTCNYAISYSNEMCTPIVLNTEYTKEAINIYPNPADDKIFIKSPEKPVRFVELIDIKGRLIYKGELSGESFNISAYQKGKYILRLYDINRKLISSKSIVKW